MEGLNEIRELLVSLTGISMPDVSAITNIAAIRSYDKGEFLLQKGNKARFSYIILEGAFREFYTDNSGREHNKAFCFKGDFTGSYYDLNSGKPSTASIQALTDSKVVALDHGGFQKLVEADLFWLKVAQTITHRLLIKKCENEYQLLSLSAKERYLLLRKEQPLLEQMVPAYQIASFLGITPVSFSRIRAQIRQ